MTIAHISDVHFGKIADERVVPALVAEVNACGVDLVVVSGDLTQRAREAEYQAAVEMIEAFEAPTLVVPGNHDVPPWWSPLSRVFRPASPFRRYIGDDTTPRFATDGIAAFGLNSSHGLTVKGGLIRDDHLGDMQAFFEEQPPEAFRVMVLHHHLVRLQALWPHDIAIGAKRALRAAAGCGVELILCGHLHQSHVAHVEKDFEEGHRLVIASAGTATSSRTRGRDRHLNFYNHVHVTDEQFTVEERRYVVGEDRFIRERQTSFDRLAVRNASPAT